MVGVNKYVTDARVDQAIPTLKIDHGPERDQIDRLRALRARRDDAACQAALTGVDRACRGGDPVGDNIMDAVLNAVKREATLGEICQVFRNVFGEHRDPAWL